jgi:alanine dehydrogenase
MKLANKGWQAALAGDAGLLKGLNVVAGKLTYQGVADAFGLKCHDPAKFLK